jgi:hypothetical protein
MSGLSQRSRNDEEREDDREAGAKESKKKMEVA